MSAESVFSLANTTALAMWVLLLALPRHAWVNRIATSAAAAIFAAAYVGIIAARWGGSSGGFSSLAAVAELFRDPWLLLAGWLHYLAFDLLVGSWEVRDARQRGLSHLLVVPCLAATFMFGPAGWLLYMTLRMVRHAPAVTVQPAAG